MSKAAQTDKIRQGNGFIAALDQSGGSTPKALRLYGVEESAYSGDAEMFDLMHAMRARIAQAPAFTGEKVIGAILFEMTMDRQIAGKPSASFLWEERGVVPFLKVDKGLADEADGVKLMKPMPELEALLERANRAGIFGTKMRSVIDAASGSGIAANVAQQFEVAAQILGHGLMPIIEPEVTISIPDKAEGRTTPRTVCILLAPPANDAWLYASGTLLSASSARVKMVGTAMNARRSPALNMFNRSCIGNPGIQESQVT